MARVELPLRCDASCPQSLSQLIRLDESWRSSRNHLLGASPHACDAGRSRVQGMHRKLSSSSWFVIAGTAGQRLPVEPPGARRCGTDLTGWLATPHPAVGQPRLNGTVCFSSRDSPCSASVDIEVCACEYGSVDDTEVTGAQRSWRHRRQPTFVYKLPAPKFCFVAYCGAHGPLPPPQLPGAYGCEEWCQAGSQNWRLKCTWLSTCGGCSPCLPVTAFQANVLIHQPPPLSSPPPPLPPLPLPLPSLSPPPPLPLYTVTSLSGLIGEIEPAALVHLFSSDGTCVEGVTFGSIAVARSELGLGWAGQSVIWIAGNCSGKFRCGKASRTVLCEPLSGTAPQLPRPTAVQLPSGSALPLPQGPTPLSPQSVDQRALAPQITLPPTAICDCERSRAAAAHSFGPGRLDPSAGASRAAGVLPDIMQRAQAAADAATAAAEAAKAAASASIAAAKAATAAAKAAEAAEPVRSDAEAIATPAEAHQGPIKVFLLAGQSNMEGHGVVAQVGEDGAERRGTLRYMARDPHTRPMLRPALDMFGRWAIHDDVWIFNNHHKPYSNGSQVSPATIDPPWNAQGGNTLSDRHTFASVAMAPSQGRKTASWGPLTVGYGKRCSLAKRSGARWRTECRRAPTYCCQPSETYIGPELSFGIRMGEVYEEQAQRLCADLLILPCDGACY